MRREHRLSPLLWIASTFTIAPALMAQADRLGVEFQVNAFTPYQQTAAAVGEAADGRFVVVWQSSTQDGSSYGVFGRRFSSAGVPLAAELQINVSTASSQGFPALAVESDGDFVVAWESPDGSGNGVFARRFSSTGAALATELLVNAYTSGGQFRPVVAASATGDFVVAWDSGGQDGSSDGIFARRFSSAGAPVATEFQVNAHTTNDQFYPVVAAGAFGDFVVAWASNGQDGASYGVFARRFSSAGSPLATEFQVNTYTNNQQTHPAVAVAPDSGFVVAWSSFSEDGSDNGVFARRFSGTGTPLATELQINVYTAGSQYLPAVAVAPNSGFVVSWHSFGQDGSGYGVLARRFSAAGVALGVEFPVNAHTALDQTGSAVAANDGRFVIVWQSIGQDGSGYGVFGQRFAAPIALDIDGDGAVGPLTDALLALRYAFGFRGATLVTGAVGAGCTRCSADSIEIYLAGLTS